MIVVEWDGGEVEELAGGRSCHVDALYLGPQHAQVHGDRMTTDITHAQGCIQEPSVSSHIEV